MEKVNNRPRDKWDIVAFFILALLMLSADQLSKTWIRSNLHLGQAALDWGFLRIIYISNSGAVFGLFPDQSGILTVIAVASIPILLSCALLAYRFLPFLDNLTGMIALGLVLGGTAGNLVDRLRYGFVTDFIDFRVWPAFNVADASITIGILIVAYLLLSSSQASNHQDGQNQ